MVAVLLASLLFPASARADPPPAREWYGWQIAIADGLSICVAVAGALAESPQLAFVGASGFSFAGPLTHFAHDNVGQGVGALGLRVAFPLMAAGLVALNQHRDLDSIDEERLVAPFVLAAVAGAALDIALLAWAKPTASPPVRVGPAGLSGRF